MIRSHPHTRFSKSSLSFIACFGWALNKCVFAQLCMFTLCVSAGIFPFHGWFSCSINILQWKLTVCKMLILIGPLNVCVWGQMDLCISRLAYVSRVAALLSIHSPFCVEMIQCASLGGYWFQRMERRWSKTESSCNVLRHLLDVRNKALIWQTAGSVPPMAPIDPLTLCVVDVWELGSLTLMIWETHFLLLP